MYVCMYVFIYLFLFMVDNCRSWTHEIMKAESLILYLEFLLGIVSPKRGNLVVEGIVPIIQVNNRKAI